VVVVGVDCCYPGTLEQMSETLRVLVREAGLTVYLQQEMRGKATKRFFRSLKGISAVVVQEDFLKRKDERLLYRIYRLTRAEKAEKEKPPSAKMQKEKKIAATTTGTTGTHALREGPPEKTPKKTEKKRLTWSARDKIINPSAERNKEVITKTFVEVVSRSEQDLKIAAEGSARVLEIASGTGQHAAAISKALQERYVARGTQDGHVSVAWYPTELTDHLFPSMMAWAGLSEVANLVQQPITIDASSDWAGRALSMCKDGYHIVYSCNCIHIAPWEVAKGILKGCGSVLRDNGLLIMYGPYAIDGKLEPESNRRFDRYLRAQNEKWGVRDLRDVEKEANAFSLDLVQRIAMPANNFIVVFKKRRGAS